MQVVIWEINEKTGHKSGVMPEGEAKLVILAWKRHPKTRGNAFRSSQPGQA